jgi:hypothetical protein
LAIAASILILAGIQNAIEYNQATRHTEYYSKQAKDQIALDCGALVGRAFSDCARQINNAAREQQRDEYDLYSQKTMALWTAVMGGMAVVGVFLSVLGVYLIWTTFRETKRTADEAREANRITREGQRPWIDFSHHEVRGIKNSVIEGRRDGESIGVILHYRSSGVRPAAGLTLWSECKVCRVGITPKFEQPRPEELILRGGNIGVGKTFGGVLRPILKAELQKIMAGTHVWWAYGYVEYSPIDDRSISYTTEVQFRLAREIMTDKDGKDIEFWTAYPQGDRNVMT